MRAVRVALLGMIGVSASTVAWACGGKGAALPNAARSSPAEVAAARGAGLRHASVVAADTLANTRIGGRYGTVLAFRFRSQWTGSVRAVRVYVAVNSDGRGGYSGGTGGKLRVTLARDSGAPLHVPTRHAIATARVTPPTRDAWPLVRFRAPADVVAGRYYHVVFTNDAADPRSNYVSINALLSYGHREPMPRLPNGVAVLLGGTRDGGGTPRTWQPRAQEPNRRYAPILDVVGGRSNEHLGLGYMEVWSSNAKAIGGAAKVRQLLGNAPGRAITGAWLRVRRREGASAALQLRIGLVTGGMLAKATVAAGKIRLGGPRWVHVRFPRPVSAPRGARLAFTATSRKPSSYEAFPIRKGTEFGFHRRTVFDGGHAQFTNGGAWVGWDQWGAHDLHTGDLQFALDLAER